MSLLKRCDISYPMSMCPRDWEGFGELEVIDTAWCTVW
jgi:hypothetical protein